jgi:hypothetical protein
VIYGAVKNTMKHLLSAGALLTVVSAAVNSAEAYEQAACPGAIADIERRSGVGFIFTGSDDTKGHVDADGARSCTIKFEEEHRTAPRCSVSGLGAYHVVKRVRTTPKEVIFTFKPRLPDSFDYTCIFKD